MKRGRPNHDARLLTKMEAAKKRADGQISTSTMCPVQRNAFILKHSWS